MNGVLSLITRPSLIIAAVAAAVILLLWFRLRRDQFWMLAAGVVVALVLGEVLCRIVGLGAPWQSSFGAVRSVEQRGSPHPYEPKSELVYEYPDDPRGYFGLNNEVVGHINSLGFRGAEPGERGPGAPTRIAILGDSFALGFGVRDDDTLPAQLESHLRLRAHEVEVLNFGASDTGTPEQVDLLEDYVLGFEPDVVVLLFFLNDTDRVGTNAFISRALTLGRLRARSHLVNALVTAVERVVVTRQMVSHYLEGYEEESPGWIEVRSALLRARELARAKRFGLIVAVHPVLFRLDESHPFVTIHGIIADFCEAEGIEHVDLLDAFMGEDDKELWVHSTDHHPNELAHGMSAAYLAEHLMRSGLGDRRAWR